MIYLKIGTDKTITALDLDDSSLLAECYRAIDCDTIDIVPTGYNRRGRTQGYLIIDDNGKIRKKPINAFATMLYGAYNDVIVGDVLYCRLNDDGDDVCGFISEQSAYGCLNLEILSNL